MGEFVLQAVVAFVIFMGVDLLWLGVLAKNFYKSKLGKMMAPKPNWTAAVTFYIFFLIGLVYFAINPGIDSGNFSRTLTDAGLYGFFTYMTYELTNYAVIKNWPRSLVVPDILWGVVLSLSVSSLTYLLLA